jgi:hypothetical protein
MDTVCHPSTTQETSVNTPTGVCAPPAAAQHIIYNLSVSGNMRTKFRKPTEMSSSLTHSVLQVSLELLIVAQFAIMEPQVLLS